MNGSLDVILGPMFSGKSTSLLNSLAVAHSLGRKVLYINNIIDTRSEQDFSTHGLVTHVPFKTIRVSSLSDVDVEDYDVIGVDEAQFFNSLVKEVLKWVETGKDVIVSGLSGTSEKVEFGELIYLIPRADTFTQMKAKCTFCAKKGNHIDAPFTMKYTSTKVNEKGISVGSDDKYAAVCRMCWSENN